ncbi:MAG: DNA methyltransferase, partial [Gemmatimonadota bacterium]
MSATHTALLKLAERWADAAPAKRSNAQLYLTELADALGVERPRPSGAGYEFEHAVRVVTRDGTETVKFADLYKEDCFLLEAKDQEEGPSTDILLRRAFGQAVEYAAFVPGGAPPYLLVLDVGRTLLVWDRWHGTYGGFRAGRSLELKSLADRPEDIALLRDIWERPEARDPRARAAAVTREIARHLAELAGALEGRGHDHETVARFLIRTVFTLFAEDVGLLPGRPFQALVEGSFQRPERFGEGVVQLWRAMDSGGWFGAVELLQYNGHFFRDAAALPLTREDLAILREAAHADWSAVEPAIFGTLFTRALDQEERHRLGAEFTPPAYVERLVRVTIEEPVREQWTLVQAEVIQLRERGRKKDLRDAVSRLRWFHERLRAIRVLDPACGSGNFLYVSLSTLKRIELEVIREIEAITGAPELQIEEVDPGQFHGIEIKMWAREITELTLWIGHHQWWRQTHGHTQPPEPILKDTGTLECRDAVLSSDATQEDPARARPDPTPCVRSPVTGELVPDPDRQLAYMEHVNPGQAEWPRADYIVGNPPYMGNKRMREAFGDGYVDALRAAYPEVPESADYVMYWWYRAAEEVAEGRTKRAGLITTNSITQTFNRGVVANAMDKDVGVVWAIPTHPWVDEAGSAAVRVAMTVMEREPASAVR